MSRNIPEGALIKLLKEISPQKQDQYTHVYLAQHGLFLLDGEGGIPMAGQEVRGTVVFPLDLRGRSNRVGGILGVRGSHISNTRAAKDVYVCSSFVEID